MEREISDHFCECGCGLLTPIANRTDESRNMYKGKPILFLQGHRSQPSKEEQRLKRNQRAKEYYRLGKHKIYKKTRVGLRRIVTHRIIMEKYLGRALKSNEQVHHKDGNPFNNDINNLEIMDKEEHTRLHVLERWYGGMWEK